MFLQKNRSVTYTDGKKVISENAMRETNAESDCLNETSRRVSSCRSVLIVSEMQIRSEVIAQRHAVFRCLELVFVAEMQKINSDLHRNST